MLTRNLSYDGECPGVWNGCRSPNVVFNVTRGVSGSVFSLGPGESDMKPKMNNIYIIMNT